MATQSRKLLLLLILIFLIPIAFAIIAYQNRILWFGTTNHGILLKKLVPIANLDLQSQDGIPIKNDFFKNHWTLLLLETKSCDKACQEKIYDLRQIRLATGKDMERIQRVLITLSSENKPELDQLITKYFPETKHFNVPEANLLEFFKNEEIKNVAISSSSLYLVDPLGNIMMVYRHDEPAKGILKDLKRLLYVSK